MFWAHNLLEQKVLEFIKQYRLKAKAVGQCKNPNSNRVNNQALQFYQIHDCEEKRIGQEACQTPQTHAIMKKNNDQESKDTAHQTFGHGVKL